MDREAQKRQVRRDASIFGAVALAVRGSKDEISDHLTRLKFELRRLDEEE